MPPALPQTSRLTASGRERGWGRGMTGLWRGGSGAHLCLGGRLAAFLALGGLLLAFLSAGGSGPRFVSFGGLWSLFLRLQQGGGWGLLIFRRQWQWLQVIGAGPGPQVRVVQQQPLLLLSAGHAPVHPDCSKPAPRQWC